MKKRMDRQRRVARARRIRLISSITAALLATSWMTAVHAAPASDTVPVLDKIQSGDAAITSSVNAMVIDQTVPGATHNVAIDWKSFDIGEKSSVHFEQAPTDVALNRITGQNPSEIFGDLSAKGRVLLINPNGIIFGSKSTIDVGGIVASTGHVSDADMQAFADRGSFTSVIDPASDKAITVEGDLQAHQDERLQLARNEGGIVVLHAAKVTNKGDIWSGRQATISPDSDEIRDFPSSGDVQLAAVQTMDYANDGKITFDVDASLLKNASVLNSGHVTAEDGYIAMTARAADGIVSSVVNDTHTQLRATGMKVSDDGATISLVSDGYTDNYGDIDASDGNVLMQVKEAEKGSADWNSRSFTTHIKSYGQTMNQEIIRAGGKAELLSERGTVCNIPTALQRDKDQR